MKIVKVFIPEAYVILLNRLVEEGYYPSKREAIRTGIRDFLACELKVYKSIIFSQNIPEKFDLLQELFSQIFSSHTFSFDLKYQLLIVLKVHQDLGIWNFRYDGLYTTVYLLHRSCISCPTKCQKIQNEKYTKICLRKVTTIPPMADFSSADLEFIAKVYYILKYKFPPNEENRKRKLPHCKGSTVVS